MSRDYWNTIAPKYEEAYGNARSALEIQTIRNVNVADLPSSCKNVIDLGCGTGQAIEFFPVETYADYIGTDLSPAMITMARTKHPGGLFVVADLNLPLPFGDSVAD